MNDKFDELTKGMAQSVTRRGALKKFGLGLAGIALASLGLNTKATAGPASRCNNTADCPGGLTCCNGKCVDINFDRHNCGDCGKHCPGGKYWNCRYATCVETIPIP